MSEAAGQGVQANQMTGIGLKLASVVFFVAMATCIKAAGDGVPPGQLVFFRSAMAMIPVFIYLAARRQLSTAFATKYPFRHIWRGMVGVMAMGCGFYGLTQLPLPDAIALGYARPLLMVVLASLVLGETIRVYRWSAVGVGLVGVMVISWPLLTIFDGSFWQNGQTRGVVAVLVSAFLVAFVMILVRRLVETERTPTIVLYFSLSATALSLLSLPFGWVPLDAGALALLIMAGILGGLGQIFLTHSYRYAEVSTIAPFEYTSIVFAMAIGYLLFGDVPQWSMITGTAIVVAAGLYIIVREHRLGVERREGRRFTTPQG